MIAIIAAYAHNRVIGNKGIIPWKIPGEQKLFRKLTTDNVVIMGRRTYEEIGRPLPDRITIVISKSRKYSGENLYSADDLETAVKLAHVLDPDKDVYLSGGESVYSEGIELADILYLTEIDMYVEGDTFFPETDEKKYIKTLINEVTDDISYKQYKYERIK
ncbi:dihydrofolate reductase [Howardella ureilytica]